jgi:uncharacterized glyoxalase superfamily protein PhnB
MKTWRDQVTSRAEARAEELMRFPTPDGKIMHAEIRIGDSTIMLGDEMPDYGGKSPKSYGGTPVGFFVYRENVDAAWKRALDAGGKEVMPLMDQFWGDRAGCFEDPSRPRQPQMRASVVCQSRSTWTRYASTVGSPSWNTAMPDRTAPESSTRRVAAQLGEVGPLRTLGVGNAHHGVTENTEVARRRQLEQGSLNAMDQSSYVEVNQKTR